ncbi:hypothetical protein T4B_8526 [Trichinella pseudospiralis]|uniref:Uncharacterized protein n=2 Tax=Trichinella pseudospiralis TaxID=6337 RepID=A0A0V1J3I2_TRIPS|nr:hypothetical protein T4D_1078 [Trichinella pseudospiralis]KRZ29558.1 hypothetical protein T4B_8526 [Trichinella pseudospiralis]
MKGIKSNKFGEYVSYNYMLQESLCKKFISKIVNSSKTCIQFECKQQENAKLTNISISSVKN